MKKVKTDRKSKILNQLVNIESKKSLLSMQYMAEVFKSMPNLKELVLEVREEYNDTNNYMRAEITTVNGHELPERIYYSDVETDTDEWKSFLMFSKLSEDNVKDIGSIIEVVSIEELQNLEQRIVVDDFLNFVKIKENNLKGK